MQLRKLIIIVVIAMVCFAAAPTPKLAFLQGTVSGPWGVTTGMSFDGQVYFTPSLGEDKPYASWINVISYDEIGLLIVCDKKDRLLGYCILFNGHMASSEELISVGIGGMYAGWHSGDYAPETKIPERVLKILTGG